MTTFKVSINGNKPFDYAVETTVYIDAVASIPAHIEIPPLADEFVVEKYGDIGVEIWVESLLLNVASHFFVIRRGNDGHFHVMTARFVP